MPELRLRARTVSEIVDAAFALYRQNVTQYILVTALAFSPLLIVQLLMSDTMQQPQAFSDVASLIITVVSWITYSLMSAVITKLGSQAYLGQEPDIVQAVREVLPQIPAVLVATFLKAILLFVGLCVFVFGVFYVVARYFAVLTTVVVEDRGPFSAFGRSTALSQGRKRFILNALILVYIIYGVLSVGVLVLAGIPKSPILSIIASSAFTIIAYPVIGLTEMLLYYDARIRGEGFDLEQMAAALDATPATDGPTL